MKSLIVLVVLALALFLAGCSEKVCEVDADCQREHFTGVCLNNNCTYTPIPNECGNDVCEASTAENTCTCPQDCGACSGSAPDSQHLFMTCDSADTCSTDVGVQQLDTYTSQPLRSGGDTFTIISTYNTPFNTRRDQLDLTLYLSQANTANSNHHINTIEITAETLDRRTLILASHNINKPLYGAGRENGITEQIRFDFPTSATEEDIRNIRMSVTYSYTTTSGTTQTARTGTLINPFNNVQLTYVVPSATYSCPASCDDGNPGTTDTCDASTDYFCTHTPVAGTCGNFLCEGTENTCTCPQDCGLCARETTYLRYACQEDTCQGNVKPSVTQTEESVFDPRPLTGFTLSNTYTYNNPFIVSADTLTLDLELQNPQTGFESVSINAVRVLEGTRILGQNEQPFTLNQAGQTVTIPITLNPLAQAESDKTLTLRVEYTYTRNGQAQSAQFTKTLNRATYLSP